MYLRHSTVTKNGKTYTYWRPARPVRVGRTVRPARVARLSSISDVSQGSDSPARSFRIRAISCQGRCAAQAALIAGVVDVSSKMFVPVIFSG